jgi:hypothetical protein
MAFILTYLKSVLSFYFTNIFFAKMQASLSLDITTTRKMMKFLIMGDSFFSLFFICIHKWIGPGQIILNVYAICK